MAAEPMRKDIGSALRRTPGLLARGCLSSCTASRWERRREARPICKRGYFCLPSCDSGPRLLSRRQALDGEYQRRMGARKDAETAGRLHIATLVEDALEQLPTSR